MEELKACPFCGWEQSRTQFNSSGLWYWVKCVNASCRAEGPVAVSQAEARLKWNRRAMLVPGLGTVMLADTLVIPEGAVETGVHAEERHTKAEADEVRAAGQAAIIAEPMLGKQPPCKNDGRTRLIFPMKDGWGVWVLEQIGDQLYREITAFKTTNREYVRRVRDDCGNGSWFGHSYAQ